MGKVTQKDVLVRSAMLAQTVTIPENGGETLFVVQSRAGEQREDAFQEGEYVRLRVLQFSDGVTALVDCWGTVRKDEVAFHVKNGWGDPQQRWWFTPVDNAQRYVLAAGTLLMGYGKDAGGYYMADDPSHSPYSYKLTEIGNGHS